MLEPVQGEGGVNIPDEGYLKAVRRLCDDQGWLFICDEIQTGMCRTGKWFAHQHEGISPDVMTLAKALGNGFPIGACLARGMAADLFRPGSHGSTYGGNPLACRAGLTVIEVMTELKLDKRAGQMGQSMLDQFRSALSDINGVVSIRGKGLMLGIELDRECSELVNVALDERLLINVTAGKVIRLLPALTMSDQEAGQVIDTVIKLTQDFLQ